MMTYRHEQSVLAEVLINGTEFKSEGPFLWGDGSSKEYEITEVFAKKKTKELCSEKTFEFHHLSYKKAIRKIHFYEVNILEEDAEAQLDSVWKKLAFKM
ncbi:hypothetical protein AKO1_009886 [Acrasis kona]|uniref:Uncharacterized protein n=1 Tax=Acrasis kona TaxID=1008807 RepID=A0AAW2ZRC4_9EUKA